MTVRFRLRLENSYFLFSRFSLLQSETEYARIKKNQERREPYENKDPRTFAPVCHMRNESDILLAVWHRRAES